MHLNSQQLETTDEFYRHQAGRSYSDETVDRWLQRWLAPHVRLPASCRVLDLCCGDGVWSFGLLRLATRLEVVGVDISPGAIEAARGRGLENGAGQRAQFLVHDAEISLPFADGSFDLIFGRGLFLFNQHDMLRPEALNLIEQWHAKLKPSGVFYSSYGSKQECMGRYVPMENTRLPLNHLPRRTAALDFHGGKFHHTPGSFVAPFLQAHGVWIRKYAYEQGRHTLLTARAGVADRPV